MKPFDQLSERGQVRRLRPLAHSALAAYGVQAVRLEFVALHTNTLFRVRATDGQKWMLRICTPGEHSDAERRTEAMWLNVLSDAGFPTPRVRLTLAGEPFVYASAAGVPGARACSLLSWIPGRSLEERESAENYAKMGRLMAQMHNFAQSFAVPATFRPMQWNTTFYWNDDTVVFDPAYAHLITADRRAILQHLIPRVDHFLETLFAREGKPIIIHGDFHPGNVHRYRGKLYALDFEDIMLGHPLQDVAISLYYGREEADCRQWRAAFKAAYAALRPWPERHAGEIETLIVGRMLTFINYVTHAMGADSAEKYLSRWFGYLQTYIDSNYQSLGA